MHTNSFKSISIIIIFFFSISGHAQNERKIRTDEFKVKGVCNMCKDRIENGALIKGVKMAEWNIETSILKVVYKPDKVALNEIHKAVAEVGHSTEKLDADKVAYENLPDCCKYDDGVKKH